MDSSTEPLNEINPKSDATHSQEPEHVTDEPNNQENKKSKGIHF